MDRARRETYVLAAAVAAVAWLLAPTVLVAQTAAPFVFSTTAPPLLKINKAGDITPLGVAIARDMRPEPAFEVPPVVVQGAPDLFFVSTDSSWLCRASEPPMVVPEVNSKLCRRFSTSDRIDLADGRNRSPAEAARLGQDWGRSYQGVFSALKLSRPWRGYDLFTVLHGENKNERFGSSLYANTVNTNISPASCASGYAGENYDDCWPAYNAFISLRLANTASAPAGEAIESLDLGPILWPTMGYRHGDEKTSSGLRHPSVIVHGGYLYIFYTDTSQSNEDGRRGGVHVARMALPTSDTPPMSAAIPYYDGAFSDSNPSLPRGFSKDRIDEFYDRPGGRASELWPRSWQVVRFAVARINGTSAFIGVEEFVAGREWGIRLRVSSDLLRWSNPVAVPGEHSHDGWNRGTLHYPVFSDLSGQTSVDIDPSGFYLLGTRQARPVRQQVSIEFVP
jgi:hypothetical protein